MANAISGEAIVKKPKAKSSMAILDCDDGWAANLDD